MPRISLYRPEKSADYRFLDRTIYEQFQAGGVDVYVHKYVGPIDPADPSKALGESSIQDIVFLENRDRKYDDDIRILRGHYQVQDLDFNLSQFALFLNNDILFLTLHINNSVDLMGRKVMAGDVFELPNLKDEYALNSYSAALKRFYVVEEVTRAAEGFSAVWYPHLYRVKLKPMVDSQEFKDILERPEDADLYAGVYSPDQVYYPGQVVRHKGKLYVVKDAVGPNGTSLEPPDTSAWDLYNDPSLKDIMSTYEKELSINNASILEAEQDALLSGHEISHFFTLAVDPVTGRTVINTADSSDNVASAFTIGVVNEVPLRDGYSGYLLQDGKAANVSEDWANSQFGYGVQFPVNPNLNDTYLRTDYLPNRLFRYDGSRWIRVEDNVRMTLTNTDDRQTQKLSFINNNATSGIGRIASDVVIIRADGTPQFELDSITTNFELLEFGSIITTNLPFTDKFKVEVWLDENSQANKLEVFDSAGFLAFQLDHEMRSNTRIRYTIYSQMIEQRQFPSKALRKIKPVADN